MLRNTLTSYLLGLQIAAISLFSLSQPIAAQTTDPVDVDQEDTDQTDIERINDPSKIEDSTWFTMMPMFMPTGQNSLSYDNLLPALVADQGYEAFCANTEWEMTTEMFGELEKFFREVSPPAAQDFFTMGGRVTFGSKDPYIVDFARARIPLVRGMEAKEKTLKNSSFEGMFGANNRQNDTEYYINQFGVAQDLLSTYEQCIYKMQNALTIGAVCYETKIPDQKCTLNKEYAIDIIVDDKGNSRAAEANKPLGAGEKRVGLGFSISELIGYFQELRPELSRNNDELIPQVCADITTGDPIENGQDPVMVAQIRAAVDRIGIDIDSLYRLAFLVLAPTQDIKNETPNDKFSFLNGTTTPVNKKYHAPIYIAFKIPEFGTNKSRLAGNIDSLELTKLVLQSKEQNEIDLKNQDMRRSSLLAAAEIAGKQAARNQIDGLLVKCPLEYPQCERESGKNILRNALTDLINAANPHCNVGNLQMVLDQTASGSSMVEAIFNNDDLNWENAGDLFTPATKDFTEKEYAFKAAANLQLQNSLSNYGENAFKWELLVDKAEEPDFGEPIKVNAYIVLPMGETIKDVNKSFSIFWQQEDFLDMVLRNVIIDMNNKNGVIPKFYTVQDGVMGMNSIDRRSLADTCRQETAADPTTGATYTKIVCDQYEFGARVKDAGAAMFPDFGLGWMIRKVQMVVRATFEQSYNYIKSCNRVEDMFLGRCSGDPEGNSELLSMCSPEGFAKIKGMPSAAGVTQQAKDVFMSDIGTKITEELMEAYAYAEEQTGIPCAVVAGIHWTEGGMNATQSVFDGGALRGGSLKEDAKLAMEHLITKFQGGFDRENISYEKLVEAIAYYNGVGNLNCDFDTRWKNGGKCPSKFPGEDQPHPTNWIDSRHTEMDLMYCLDFVQFSCNIKWNDASANQLQQLLEQKAAEGYMDPSRIETLMAEASSRCYESSPVCQEFGSGGKFIRYERPGSLTVAILINDGAK